MAQSQLRLRRRNCMRKLPSTDPATCKPQSQSDRVKALRSPRSQQSALALSVPRSGLRATFRSVRCSIEYADATRFIAHRNCPRSDLVRAGGCSHTASYGTALLELLSRLEFLSHLRHVTITAMAMQHVAVVITRISLGAESRMSRGSRLSVRSRGCGARGGRGLRRCGGSGVGSTLGGGLAGGGAIGDPGAGGGLRGCAEQKSWIGDMLRGRGDPTNLHRGGS